LIHLEKAFRDLKFFIELDEKVNTKFKTNILKSCALEDIKKRNTISIKTLDSKKIYVILKGTVYILSTNNKRVHNIL